MWNRSFDKLRILAKRIAVFIDGNGGWILKPGGWARRIYNCCLYVVDQKISLAKILLSPFDKIEKVINNPLMQNEAEQYENNPDFREFLNREFDKTAIHATIEELAEFAFGGIDAAIETYEKHKKDVT